MAAPSKHRALIVEDHYLIAIEIEQLLRDLGYNDITCAATLANAMEAVEVSEFDLVTVDVQLMDGDADMLIELLDWQGVPYIYLTGYERPSFPAPGVPWLVKPIDDAEFMRAVRTVTAPESATASR